VAHLPGRAGSLHYIECDDYDRAIAELAANPVNERWQTEMAPMMAVAHDYSGGSTDRLPIVFELQRESRR